MNKVKIISLLVLDYDAAIEFYTGGLNSLAAGLSS